MRDRIVVISVLLLFVAYFQQLPKEVEAVDELKPNVVTVEIVEEPNNDIYPAIPQEEVPEDVLNFVRSYGGMYDREYLQDLTRFCGDTKELRIVIAISVAETGMGKAVNKRSNFYGWYKNGDVNYDPERSEMAKEICEGIKTWYSDIDSYYIADVYTGGDRTSTWYSNFSWALSQMNKF